eukprot:Phypoly_transcript_02820.p1 GENE.Phypoly_transcript_02820~~Phypoly_transcript_02820.p1  ORF type:complete len:708 (+),score=115.89 Phypoly_transcript_02820:192-2315(+)
MSDTPAPCEVIAVEGVVVGKLDLMENGEPCILHNGGVGNAQVIEDSHEEDNGEASDETSSRRESNSSADGNEHFEQQTTNEDQDNNTDTQADSTTQNTPRKKKKKRRSRRKSRTHSRSNSFQNNTTNTITTTEELIIIDTNITPQPDTPNPPVTDTEITEAIPLETTDKDTNIPQQTPDQGTTNEITSDIDVTLELTDTSATKDTTHTTSGDTPQDNTTDSDTTEGDTPLKLTTEQDTKDLIIDSNPSSPIGTPIGSPVGSPINSPRTPSSSSPRTDELSHIPHHLLELTPPPTRGRSNAFYGSKLPPPLLHSHSDGAAIVAQHNTSASISPRRNTVGLGVTVTPTIPEPSHSGLSKPRMFTWRVSNPSCAFLNFAASPPLEKGVLSHSRRFLVGFAETIGRRPSMEDCMVVHGAFRGHGHEDYFALFDGHGGRDAAAFAAEHLHEVLAEKLKTNNPVKSLKEAFADTNKMISDQKVIGGTTAVVALFIGKKGFIANVGDTRAVLCRDGVPLRVSLDHKPELPTETSRIRKLGGTVTTTYNSAGQATSRVNGMLSVSRALGDTPLHPYVSSDPEIHGPLNLETEARNQFVVLACDGVWDVLTDEEATRYFITFLSLSFSPSPFSRLLLSSSTHGPLNLETEARNQFVVLACDGVWDVLTDEEATSIVAPIANPEIASRRLRDEAFARGSTDNISVMVIRCPPFIPCD